MPQEIEIIPPSVPVETSLTAIPDSVEQAAAWVGEAYRAGIIAWVETGRRLAALRDAYADDPGAWSRLLGRGEDAPLLPFGKTQAYRFLDIAEAGPWLVPHVGQLPADVHTVHLIAKAGPDKFEERLKAGAISPDMRRADLNSSGNGSRHENDFYPTPESIVDEIVSRWFPMVSTIWEPCSGDGRIANAFRAGGYHVIAGDIAEGDDFFAHQDCPNPGIALCTNPPFDQVREFIDHAFAIGIQKMCLVLPERIWASSIGREQFEKWRPTVWVNLDWREDYLGKGGSPDRALAVAIWDRPCADRCTFEIWTRQPARPESKPDATPAGAVATEQAATLTSDEQNALIKVAYEAGEVDLHKLADATGLNENTIKQRAKRRKWGDPANQRAAASRLMTELNRKTAPKQEA